MFADKDQYLFEFTTYVLCTGLLPFRRWLGLTFVLSLMIFTRMCRFRAHLKFFLIFFCIYVVLLLLVLDRFVFTFVIRYISNGFSWSIMENPF